MVDALLGWTQIGKRRWAMHVPPDVTVDEQTTDHIRVLLKTLRDLAKNAPKVGCSKHEDLQFRENLFRTSPPCTTHTIQTSQHEPSR